jgi:hypothetical protein
MAYDAAAPFGLFYLSLAIGPLSAFAAGPLKDRSTLSLTSTVTG